MPFYRVTVTPSGFWETDLLSTTIWGHFAWIIRFRDGLEKFREWLNEQIERPWLISSFMPKGYLPKPKLTPYHKKYDQKPAIKEIKFIKKIKKVGYIKEEVFKKMQYNMSEHLLIDSLKEGIESIPIHAKDVQPHNTINRISGKTLNEGGLYFHEVNYIEEGAKYQFFVHTQNDELSNLREILTILSDYGFGANKSTGKGKFSFEVNVEDSLFTFEPEKNVDSSRLRAMTLSHGVITDNMKDALYKIHVHFGKLGGDLCLGGHSPFKYPLIMVTPGSTFSIDNPSYKDIYGEIVGDVHHALKDIRQYACHLPIFFREVSEIGTL